MEREKEGRRDEGWREREGVASDGEKGGCRERGSDAGESAQAGRESWRHGGTEATIQRDYIEHQSAHGPFEEF